MKLRKGKEEDIDECISLAEELDSYFEETALSVMDKDLGKHEFIVAEDDRQILGFIVYDEKSKDVVEISWMAVKYEKRRKGIGSNLLKKLEKLMEDKKVIMVKTLARKEKYEPYEHTRKFYESKGFFLLETIDPYPGWDEGNPAAIYLKII